MNRHAGLMEASGFWRQFVTTFYFDTPGDEIAGTLVSYRADGRGDDAVPVIRLQTREGRLHEVTAFQERLKAELVRLEPAAGDRLRITYTGEADRAAPGMSKAKLFTVEIRRQGTPPPDRTAEKTVAGTATPAENGTGAGK